MPPGRRGVVILAFLFFPSINFEAISQPSVLVWTKMLNVFFLKRQETRRVLGGLRGSRRLADSAKRNAKFTATMDGPLILLDIFLPKSEASGQASGRSADSGPRKPDLVRDIWRQELASVDLTREWLPSTKNSACVQPAPECTGGAVNSSKTPATPWFSSSRTSAWPDSAMARTPALAGWPRRNRL